jgi:LytS/YehU family sensor histidine kinase
VTLGEEIDLCEAHLRVMSLRREASYRLEVNVPDRAAPIPPALLHTLVENAITHGGPAHVGERVVRLVETRTAGGNRVIELLSPMTAHTGARVLASERSDGTGLRYVKARLEESFPGHWTFEAAPVGEGWRVRIVLAPGRALAEVT